MATRQAKVTATSRRSSGKAIVSPKVKSTKARVRAVKSATGRHKAKTAMDFKRAVRS